MWQRIFSFHLILAKAKKQKTKYIDIDLYPLDLWCLFHTFTCNYFFYKKKKKSSHCPYMPFWQTIPRQSGRLKAKAVCKLKGEGKTAVRPLPLQVKAAKSHRATFKQQEPEDKFISCCWNSSNRLGWLWQRITGAAESPLSCVCTSNDVRNIFPPLSAHPELKASVHVRFSRRHSSGLPAAGNRARSLRNSHGWGLKAQLSEFTGAKSLTGSRAFLQVREWRWLRMKVWDYSRASLHSYWFFFNLGVMKIILKVWWQTCTLLSGILSIYFSTSSRKISGKNSRLSCGSFRWRHGSTGGSAGASDVISKVECGSSRELLTQGELLRQSWLIRARHSARCSRDIFFVGVPYGLREKKKKTHALTWQSISCFACWRGAPWLQTRSCNHRVLSAPKTKDCWK